MGNKSVMDHGTLDPSVLITIIKRYCEGILENCEDVGDPDDIDYYNGQEDIAEEILTTIGDRYNND